MWTGEVEHSQQVACLDSHVIIKSETFENRHITGKPQDYLFV